MLDERTCSERAAQRGDAMLGTAPPAARVLVIEHPGPWGRAALSQSGFGDDAAAALLRRTAAAGICAKLIRRPGRAISTGGGRWGLADSRDGHRSMRCGTFAAVADLVELALDGSAGEPDDRPVYLVCAHGKHVCCAVRGRPVAATLHGVDPGPGVGISGARCGNAVISAATVRRQRFGSAAWSAVRPGRPRVGCRSGIGYGRRGVAARPVAWPDRAAPGRAGRPRVRSPNSGDTSIDAHRLLARTSLGQGRAVVAVEGADHDLDVVVETRAVTAEGLTCITATLGTYLTYGLVQITRR